MLNFFNALYFPVLKKVPRCLLVLKKNFFYLAEQEFNILFTRF